MGGDDEKASLPRVQPLSYMFKESGHVAPTNGNGASPSSPSKSGKSAAHAGVSYSPLSKGILLFLTISVVMFNTWLQERISRHSQVARETLLLAQTSAHVVWGLSVSALSGGRDDVIRCLNPRKYVIFAPAALAYLLCDFLTYTAVKGLGASQFFLLSQLRIAVSAVLLRVWRGVQQSWVEWLALLQLSIGLLVLVQLKQASSPSTSTTLMELVSITVANKTVEGIVGAPSTSIDSETDGLREQTAALIALAGILASSAFAQVYQEVQMKNHKSDSIAVQMHHLNVFQVLISLSLNAQREGGNGILDGWDSATVCFWLLCVGRGFLCSFLIKVFDSVVKGLADVAAMVGVFALQVFVDQKPTDGPVAGLQIVLLLSVLLFFVGRQAAAESATLKAPAKQEDPGPNKNFEMSPPTNKGGQRRRQNVEAEPIAV